ncbi:MAG: bifunctional riboflavin kinase/FAD synthetase [Bacteroidetes bacterium]|nr:bifunctional riboflavin kinase/FAD synthetase [Bacteroidota bacterium]
MQYARRLEEIGRDADTVATVGSFDGVHLAHRQIIGEVVQRARRRNGRSVLITFDPHPREVLRPGANVVYLSSPEERRDVIAPMGVDAMLVLPFTVEFSRLSSREFVERFLVHGTGLAEMVEGYNHHFGHNREGSVSSIRELAKEYRFETYAVPQLNVGGTPVSSSAVRSFLEEGKVEAAAAFLGRPYDVTGIVIPGDRRGRTLGYPTANLAPSFSRKMIPRNGIYIVGVDVGDGIGRYGLASIGVRPTFHSAGPRTIEVFILSFDQDLYGRTISTTFLVRLRDEERYDDVASLIRQMDRDRAAAEAFVAARQR